MRTQKSTVLKYSDFEEFKLSQQTFFSIFWSIAMFFNGFRQGIHLDSGIPGIIGLFVFALSTLLIMKPSSTSRLIALSFFGVLDFIVRLPTMPNHFFIMGMVNIAIVLGWFLSKVLKQNDFSFWFIKLAPFLRLSFVVIYGFAALAKLNSGFFEPVTSCAFVLPEREAASIGIDIDFTQFGFLPLLITASEVGIFLGLLFRRISSVSVMFACVFHVLLSLTPESQGLGFTFVLIALLSLFVPEIAQKEVIQKALYRQKKIDAKIPLRLFKNLFIMSAISIAFGWLIVGRDPNINLLLRWKFSLFVLICAAIVMIGICFVWRRNQLLKPMFAINSYINYLLFFVVLLTGLSPYMGLKTRPTFTMFSNLKVEGNQTNHYFMPRLFPNNLADDLVTIISSSNQSLARDGQAGIKWVYLELQRKLSLAPQTAISYERGGVIYNLEKASDDPELVNPNWFLTKLLSFRRVYPDNTCSW